MDPTALDDLLDRVPGWPGRYRTVTALDGGITNRNYRVELDDGAFVVRAPGKDTDLLGIDRDHELEAARRAADLGIAPEVVAFVEPDGALVTRFVDGRPPASGELASGPLLDAAVDVLRRYHGSGPVAAVFDWYRVPQDYAATAVAHGTEVPDAYGPALAVADRVRAAFGAAPEPACPCHNDLLPANFLARDDGAVWLLDWEYAGMNDRYFDLGNFAVNNDLGPAGDEALVAAYFGSVTPRRLARLRLMKVISDLREAMWGVVQSGISVLDFDFDDYADEHFDRLLVNASRAGFDRLLEDAATEEEPDA